MYRQLSSSHWLSISSFNPTLSKGPVSTTWIWNLHATPHDFYLSSDSSDSLSIARKVIAVGFAHISVILLWLSGMLFHGAYFSNYVEWLRDPLHVKPSAQVVWSIVGQDILNADVGGFFKGLYITSGLFQVWYSHGIVTYVELKFASLAGIIACFGFLALAYFVMHVSPLYTRPTILSLRHLVLLTGLASIAWAGHLLHISAPVLDLMESGVDPTTIPAPQFFLSNSVFSTLGLGYKVPGLLGGNSESAISFIQLLQSPMSASGCLNISLQIMHHLYLGIVLIISGLVMRNSTGSSIGRTELGSSSTLSWNLNLAIGLLVLATLCFVLSQAVHTTPVYPYLSTDYATVLCIYTHHMWIGGFLMVGAGAHGSIYLLSEFSFSRSPQYISAILAHRDSLIAHLIWVTIFLGFHSFGLYIHNDTMQALGRVSDTFSDTAIQLRPIFANVLGYHSYDYTSYDVQLYAIGTTVLSHSQFLGTSDFMIHHIHAFTIHTTVLVLMKGLLYSRSSRLVSDKFRIGFRYPCDGPGRGGTCQISSWDAIFLALFWMYNSISILIFHFFWKMQSDVWGSLDSTSGKLLVNHPTSGDFSFNSSSINGWLRNFLWTQSAQVIQSYSTSSASLGLIFLGAHLIWAFSLMFLYSGRGYWQELIETILWSHSKLRVFPQIQPRALSISQGRAVGISHYILGGIGCTWSFFIARVISLSS